MKKEQIIISIPLAEQVKKPTTKRIEQAKEKSEKQIKEQTEKLKAQVAQDTATNRLSMETMKACIENGITSDIFGQKLLEFSSCVAQGRLKTLLSSEKTWNEFFYELRKDIATKKNLVSFLENMKETNGDGNDLQSVVYISVLEYLNSIPKEKYTETTLLDIFYIFDAKSQLYKNGDLKDKLLWTKSATNKTKELYKDVSKEIDSNKAIKDSCALYNALERKIEYTDANGEQKTEIRTIYTSASQFSAYEITDINGKQFAIVSNEQREENTRDFLASLNLSDRQKQVMDYCYLGVKHIVFEKVEYTDANGKQQTEIRPKTYIDANGKKCKVYSNSVLTLQEFADRFTLDIETVKTVNRRFLEKVIVATNKPKSLQEKIDKLADGEQPKKRNKEKQSVKAFIIFADGEKKQFREFESLKACSIVCNVSKACVSQILTGKRKSASTTICGENYKLTFEKA